MNLFSILTSISVVACTILVIIILKFGKACIHRVWALFVAFVGIWEFGGFFISVADQDQALFWWRFCHVGIIFLPVFLFHVTFLMCELKKKFFLYLAYCQAVFFIFYNFISNNFISGVRFSFSSFYYGTLGSVYHIFLCIWAIILGFSLVSLTLGLFRFSGLKRAQIKYFLILNLVGFSGGITNFLPAYGIDVYPFGSITTPLYCIISTYAILRYRLLDTTVVITRSAIFIAVYSVVLGIPIFLAFGFQPRLVDLLGIHWWALPLFCSTFLATVGPFVYLYIDRKAQDRILREQRSYQNVLRGASSGMIRIKDLKRLLSLIVRVVAKVVRIKYVGIYLFIEESDLYSLHSHRGHVDFSGVQSMIVTKSVLVKQLAVKRQPIVAEEVLMKIRDEPQNVFMVKLYEEMKALGAALIIPSLVDERLIGILVLGEKKSEKLYSSDDIIVFSVLANQAALAIENAQFYDEIQKTQEQLFQAEKMATIGTMADGLSHQINNRFHALSLISGDSIDILKMLDTSQCDEGVLSAIKDVKSGLERIQANVLQGGEVVRGLLKYSRPGEAGFEPVDIKDVIAGAIDMVQYKIKLKEINFVQGIPEGLPKLRGNLTQLQEVFFNMFDNAYDAIKERQSTLKEDGYMGKIELAASLDDGYLKVVVSDNGMGVKDKDKKCLFTPFFTTKATARKGTGLGLYVIEKIVSAHDGKLSMDSTHRSGTQFTIILPLSESR